MEETKTSIELYTKIQVVIDEIDQRFFSGKGKQKIPELVFSINNLCRSCVTAFVAPDALYDKSNNKRYQYVGINPRHLNREVGEILATICHELCHVYEHAYIHIPRGGYHDKEWDKLMRECGLEPKYLNKSKTAVTTVIAEDGIFTEYIKDFIKNHGEDYFNIVEYSPLVEHMTKVALGLDDEGEEDDDSPKPDNADKPIKKYNRNKIKYTCPECGAKVWGKSGLHIECVDCACNFEEEETEDIPA